MARVTALKEKILIRYLGLGFEEVYHEWSKYGRSHTAAELYDHFVNVVLPLANEQTFPSEPPLLLL